MIFLAPFLVKVALDSPAEVCSLRLVGLLAGSTLAKGSPIKDRHDGSRPPVGIVGSESRPVSRAHFVSLNCSTRRNHRAGAWDVRHRRVMNASTIPKPST